VKLNDFKAVRLTFIVTVLQASATRTALMLVAKSCARLGFAGMAECIGKSGFQRATVTLASMWLATAHIAASTKMKNDK
jgi:hypothetical protein